MTKIISNKSNVDLDYPVCRPSLDLDFTQEELDPRITFSRGSIGTRVNRNRLIETVAANQPRFDYDPVTGECKGLLIEESRTNSLLRSEDFSLWTASNASVQSNVITAPDGNTTADKLVENSASGNKEVTQGSITFTSGTSLTFSCFVKAGERNLFRLAATTGFFASATNAFFNLSNGTVSLIQGGITSASIIPYPNGWYRCVATMLPTSSGTGNVFITLVISGTVSNYGGDGTSGLYVWGAQLETGAFPTSYIPTSGSTVTRSAELADMTGTNFSSWYNQSEGTIYTNNRIPYTPNPNVALYFTISNPSPFSRHTVEQTTANGLIYINQNGSGNQFWSTSGSGVLSANTNRKTTYSYSSSNNITILSGTSNQTYNFGQTSRTDVNKSMTALYFGAFINSLYLNGTIARFTYYPKKLKDNQLLYLTQ
jgi:hypothetical protein